MKSSRNHSISRLLLIVVLVAVSGISRTGAGLRAQNTIGFGPTGFSGMPDSVWSGENKNVGVFVQNYGQFWYSDSVHIEGYIDTGAVTKVYFSLPSFYCQLNVNQNIFAVVPIDFSDSHMSGRFRIGNNTIVIWPVMNNPTWGTFDSLSATVFVMDSLNSTGPERPNHSTVRCFPVPASGGPLYIEGSTKQLHPKHAIVRNELGQIVAESDDPANGIDTSVWAAGIYMIEVTFDDGETGIYKVMRK